MPDPTIPSSREADRSSDTGGKNPRAQPEPPQGDRSEAEADQERPAQPHPPPRSGEGYRLDGEPIRSEPLVLGGAARRRLTRPRG